MTFKEAIEQSPVGYADSEDIGVRFQTEYNLVYGISNGWRSLESYIKADWSPVIKESEHKMPSYPKYKLLLSRKYLKLYGVL